MTVSRPEAALGRWCLAAALLLAAPSPSWGQQPLADGPPRSLALEPLVPADALRAALEEQADAQPDAVQDDLSAEASATSDLLTDLLPLPVDQTGLQQTNIAASGIITAESGGLPADMWQGTDMATAMAALQGLPTTAQSPTLQSLTRRLLASAAPPPALDQASAAENKVGWDFIDLRLRHLAAMGLLDDVVAFADLLPLAQAPTGLNQLVAEAYLLRGDWTAVCAIARHGVEADQSGYWLRMIAACRALEGNVAGAQLALDILADTGAPQPFYRALMDRLLARLDAGEPPQSDLIWPFDHQLAPLDLALGLMLDVLPPALTMPEAPALALTALASNAVVPAPTRLGLAETAVARGALPAARLHGLIMAQDVMAMDASEDGESGEDSPLSRAGSLQLAAAAVDPVARLELLTQYWTAARRADLWTTAAAVSAPIAAAIAPAPDLAAWAPEMTRALALGGRGPHIKDWYQMVRALAQDGDEALADTLLDVWALAVVADDDAAVPFSDRILDLWYQDRSGRADTGRADRALVFFSVLEGLGYVVPPMTWQALNDLGVDILAPSPAGPAWNALVAATDAGKKGETLAHALALLGANGAVGATPEALRSVLESLRRVGLEAEARQLASEALILRGF